MILAIIESKSAGISSPSLTPVSTRMPGPAGRPSSAIRPGAGAKSRSGASAVSRASPDAQRPRGALAVGYHLDLDVPGAGHQALQEHHTAAERALGLPAGALVGVGEFPGSGDDADAAATPARGRLEHHRVADPFCRAQRR